MAKEKTKGIYFKVSDKERELIEQRMALMGVRNMSAYIRKMCIDGYTVHLQIPELTECAKLLRYTSNNVNQDVLCKGWINHLIHVTAVRLWQNDNCSCKKGVKAQKESVLAIADNILRKMKGNDYGTDLYKGRKLLHSRLGP